MGIEPTPSHLWYDAQPIELPSPWEQGGGEKGYTSAIVLGAHYFRNNLLIWNTPVTVTARGVP